jgi:LysM repeat protein
MKLIKIFGIVAGIHVVALILIFANPGCSSSSKRVIPADTQFDSGSNAVVSVPNLAASNGLPLTDDRASTQINAFDAPMPITTSPAMFNPDAVAVSGDGRYSPTRPNTPVAAALKAEPVSNVVPVTTYTAVRGDSLWSIAKRNGLSVADLSAANNLRASSTLQLGQKLIIPGKSMPSAETDGGMPTVAVTTQPAKPANTSKDSVTHIVKSGETLGAIARKYQVRIGDVATANNISDPAKIRPGQSLVIPGWKAPVANTTKPVAATPAATAVVESPVQIVNNPIIFTPPPQDQPLDQGFTNDPGDAPEIQVEESDDSQSK